MMEGHPGSSISIHVSLSGYAFEIEEAGVVRASGWQGAERIFTSAELQRRYDRVEVFLFTPKFALVPKPFFSPATARQALSETVPITEDVVVEAAEVPWYNAVLIYSNSIGESLSKVMAQTVLDMAGNRARVLPEAFFLLAALERCEEYNKIIASYMDGWLYLVIAQGRTLRLCNVYPAADFTTAEYFIFLALKQLQLNPEVSSIQFRTPLSQEQEMSLYRYFRAVETV